MFLAASGRAGLFPQGAEANEGMPPDHSGGIPLLNAFWLAEQSGENLVIVVLVIVAGDIQNAVEHQAQSKPQAEV